VLTALVSSQQFGLASELAAAVSADSPLRSQLVEACMATDEHAGYRAAWSAVTQFELQDSFPLVKQRYFESTIGRMVDKGQSEAALRHAGDDATLQAAVVQRLIESGDAMTATEYAARCGMEATDLCSNEELARAAKERRDAHFQLPDSVASAVVWVDDEAGLKRAFEALSHAPVVGLDTEWAADFSKNGGGGGGGGGGRGGTGGSVKRSKKRWRSKKGEDHRDVADAANAESEDEDDEDEEDDVEEGPSAASVVALLQVVGLYNLN
jgi:hypothetical protein